MHAASIFWRRTIRVSVDLPLFQVEGAALHLRGYYNAVLPESHQRRLQILDILQIGLVVLELLRAESLDYRTGADHWVLAYDREDLLVGDRIHG